MELTDIKPDFELNAKVQTPFGSLGIIRMIGFDESGTQYFVLMATHEAWFREQELRNIPDVAQD